MHAAGVRLAEEQARSDALLYQMLPRVVADKLRKGASLAARLLRVQALCMHVLMRRAAARVQRRRLMRWSTRR